MIQTIFFNISNYIKTFGRRLRILFLTTGKGARIYWSAQVVGKGKIEVGDHSAIYQQVVLSAGISGHLSIGRNCSLHRQTVMQCVDDQSIKIGDNVVIGPNCRVLAHQHVNIENNVTFGANCVMLSREKGYYGQLQIGSGSAVGDNAIIDLTGSVIIGAQVAIGPCCIIYTHDHDYKSEAGIPWKGKVEAGAVSIGDGAWIGAGVIILPGVTIGKGAVIAAGAVVSKNVEPECLYGGVPAKLLKSLADNKVESKSLQSK